MTFLASLSPLQSNRKDLAYTQGFSPEYIAYSKAIVFLKVEAGGMKRQEDTRPRAGQTMHPKIQHEKAISSSVLFAIPAFP